MSNDLSSSLAGLALLTSSTTALATVATHVESRAVRKTKAQFTLPAVTPPWKAAGAVPDSVSAIRRMATIIDQVPGSTTLPSDVRTAFATYKALDRLRILAEFAARDGTSAAERTQVQVSFAKGIAELQRYLAVSPSDKLTLSFGQPARRAESIAFPTANRTNLPGDGVVTDRFAAMPGLTGKEVFSLSLSRAGGTSDTLTVDLSSQPQPPTLDRVAAALNSAIASVSRTDGSGNVVLGADGQPYRRWDTSFSVVKSANGWGLQLNTMGIEQVRLREQGAESALMVASGQTGGSSAAEVALTRFDLPASTLRRTSLGSLTSLDRHATAEQAILPRATKLVADSASPPSVAAAMNARAIATDADGFTYVVGTTTGDVGTQLGDGASDLVLTKVDGRGELIWQRRLGSVGSAEGAAVSVAANGDVVVAGTVAGDLDGASTDGDLLVMRFSASGAERFAKPLRAVGADIATTVSMDPSGAITVGGRSANGEALLVKVGSDGSLSERRTLGTAGEIRSLATAPDGSTLALTVGPGGATVLRLNAGTMIASASLSLGTLDARALAVSADGRIALGGTASGSGGRDGQVLTVDAGFTQVTTVTIDSGADDQVDSLTWADGKLYAGGRTGGSLGAARTGLIDGFIARLDPTGTLQGVTQWGRSGTRVEPVQVAAAPGLDSAVGALGFRTGVLNPADSERLVDTTALRTGDRWSIKVDGGATKQLVIAADDTLASVAKRLQQLGGSKVTITTASTDGGTVLRIEATPGHSIDLIAGTNGKDALAKLGLVPGRLVASPSFDAKAPRVTPGGNYGLELTTGLSVRDKALAAASLAKLKSALATTQTAFRSLYWDSNKEALVNGTSSGSSKLSSYQSDQLGRYQAALDRLTSTTVTSIF